MSESTDKIIEKIQKLLALATSSNPHEAALAARKAQDLLIKYNLDFQDLKVNFDYTHEEIEFGLKRPAEYLYVTTILSDFFFVKTIYLSPNLRTGQKAKIQIVGDKINVKIAIYVYSFLTRSFKEIWNKYKVENDADAIFKRQFYQGIFNGLRTQLREQAAASCEERGLVVVEDKGLTNYFKELHPKTCSLNSSGYKKDNDVYGAGYEEGQKLKINKSIETKSDKVGLLK